MSSFTLANFSESFAARARSRKACRLLSFSDLKRTVNGPATEVRTDLGGIRQAWLGLKCSFALGGGGIG